MLFDVLLEVDMRIILLGLLILATTVRAQEPATFSVSVTPEAVRIGETATVWIDVVLGNDWHIYSATTPEGGPYPTEFTLSGSGFKRVGPVIQPPPIKEHDPNFDMVVEYYDRSVRFGIRASVLDGTPAGVSTLTGDVTYMLCNATSCLPPTTYAFQVPITISTGQPRDEYASFVMPISSTEVLEELDGTGSMADVDRALTKGLGAFLYLSFSMGLLALLTPCVFPMIPITVSFFTKQETQSRGESIARSLAYCGGIIFTFTGLGLILALTLGASGAAQFAANPYVNLLITGIFVAFALALFGMFEIQLPYGLLNRLNQVQGGSYGAILLMGFTFSLTSFTCTAPFVGTLLVITSQGTWMWPVLGMLVFSAAFALPFFFLSLFPQALAALPQSGGWLNSVKVVMGFLELAAALKFLSNVDLVWQWGFISREVFIAVWIALFALCGVYLLGKIRLPHDSPLETVGPMRLLASVGMLSFSLFLLTGLFGAPMGELDAFFPPYGSYGEIARIRNGEPELTWADDYEVALVEAQRTGKPIFIDFTGFACTNCRWMEANIFPEPEVHNLLKNYVRVQLYTDGQAEVHERNRAFQESRFGSVALPLYVVVSPDGQTIADFPGMTRDKSLFVRFLEKGFGMDFQARNR
jgi:thiol:disulfide interchange protein DsbD